MQYIKRKNIIALIISIILSAIWSFFTTDEIYNIFHHTNSLQELMIIFYRTCSFLIVVGINMLVYYFIVNRKKHKAFIKHFLIYFSIFLVILIIFWPGIFRGDEYYTIPKVINLMVELRQHYFTSIFYTISLVLFPTLAGIPLFQIFLISIIVAYILSNVEKHLNHKRLIYLFYIVLLLPPVIDNNIFTLRSSLLSFLFLLFIFHLIFYHKDNNKSHLYYDVILSVIIACWKSEFVYLPLLFIIYIIIFYRKNISYKRVFIITLIMITAFFSLQLPQKKFKNYSLYSIVTPLSSLAKYKDIKTTVSKKDIQNIEKFAKFDNMAKYGSIYNIDGAYKANFNLSKDEMHKLYISYVKIVFANPYRFLKARWQTYKATNMPTKKDMPNHTGHETYSGQWTLEWYSYSFLKDHFKYTKNFFGENFKKKIVCALLFRNESDYSPNRLNKYVYNVSIPVLLSLLVMIISIVKRHWKEVALLVIMLVQFPIIFLFAPANFWMYYIVLYIDLYFYMMYMLINKIDTK